MTSAICRPTFKRSIIAASVLLALSIPASSAEHVNNQQYALEIINKARLDPDTYAASLGIVLNEGLTAGTISNVAKQPLAGNTLLQNAAKGHTDWMFSSNQFSHTGSGGTQPWDRATAAGYSYSTVGENLQAAYNTGLNLNSHSSNAIAQLFIDEDVDGRGHRKNLMNNNFREVGIGDGLGAWSGFGTLYNPVYLHTELFGTAKSSQPFITGVVYEDTNSNGMYDPGEGIANEGVNIGTGPVTSTTAAGGYKVVAATGSNTVNFNGGATVNVEVGTDNVKVDRVGFTIHSSANTTLVNGANTLELLGVAAINGTGSSADETLLGNRSANTLTGNGGNDTLRGRAGIDTYLYPTNSFGNDVIDDGTNDTIKFDVLQCSGLTYARSDNDLVITASSGNAITVKNYYASTTYVIKDSSNTTCTPSTVTNQPPVAGNDSATTTPGTAVTITNVLSNDSDPDGHTLTITGNTNPAKGTVTRSGNNFTYKPNTGVSNTTDSFTYTISDGNGGTATATVTITIGAAANNPPVAVDDTVKRQSDYSSYNNYIHVLQNDTDADEEDQLTITEHTSPSNGQLSLVFDDTAFLYNPDIGFVGTDTFTYTVSDGKGGSDTATVTIEVDDYTPSANDDTATTPFRTPVSIRVLDNDVKAPASDEPLSVGSFTNPGHGTVTRNSEDDSLLIYTPTPGFSGTDTFTYRVPNPYNYNFSSEATVTITVGAAPTTIDAVNDSAETLFGKPAEFNILTNDFNPPNSGVISIKSNTLPAKTAGTLTLTKSGAKAGKAKFTPKKGFSGSASFTYTVTNKAKQTDSASVTVTVKPNTPPRASSIGLYMGYEVGVNRPRLIELVGYDDEDGKLAKPYQITQPANGKVAIKGSKYYYTPNKGFVGNDSFTYTVKDSAGAVSSAVNGTIRLRVTATPSS